MIYVKENDYIYKEIDNGSVKNIVGNFKTILLNGQIATINTQINIPIIYQIFNLEQQKYITDTSIYKDVNIYVNDELIGTETILNGIGNIEFESAEVGTFKITVENYSCEVIVSEN